MLNLNPVVTVIELTAYTSELNAFPVCKAQLGGLSFTMIRKSFTEVAAGTIAQQNDGDYGSNLNHDVTQPHGFSDANQQINTEPATSANFENVSSPSYIKLLRHTAVVSASPPVSHPNYFSQFCNPNLALATRDFLQRQHRSP